MTPSNDKISATFRVGKRLTCTMTADLAGPLQLDCEWKPDVPRKLRQRDIAEYCRRRNAFFAEIGAALGQTVAVIDLAPEAARLTVPTLQPCKGRA